MRSTSWDQQDFYNIESGEQLLIQYVLQSEFNLMVLLTDKYDNKSTIIYSITSYKDNKLLLLNLLLQDFLKKTNANCIACIV